MKFYSITNLADHIKTCYSSQRKQMTMTAFIKKSPGKNIETGRGIVKEVAITLVAEGEVSLLLAENPTLLSFALLLIQFGKSKVMWM